jgi:hypothetical protein
VRSSSSMASARCRRASPPPSSTRSSTERGGCLGGLHGEAVRRLRRSGRDRVTPERSRPGDFPANAQRSKAHEGNRPRRATEGVKPCALRLAAGRTAVAAGMSVIAGRTFQRGAA